MKKPLLLPILFLLSIQQAYACTPLRPDRMNRAPAKITVSANSEFFMKSIPGQPAKEKGKWVVKREPYSIAYQALRNGQFRELWSAKDLYPFGSQFYLSGDGRYLVSMRLGVRDASDTSAIRVYHNGKIFKRFSPKNLGITDQQLKPLPCRGKGWLSAKNAPNIGPRDKFNFQTIDGKLHAINVK